MGQARCAIVIHAKIPRKVLKGTAEGDTSTGGPTIEWPGPVAWQAAIHYVPEEDTLAVQMSRQTVHTMPRMLGEHMTARLRDRTPTGPSMCRGRCAASYHSGRKTAAVRPRRSDSCALGIDNCKLEAVIKTLIGVVTGSNASERRRCPQHIPQSPLCFPIQPRINQRGAGMHSNKQRQVVSRAPSDTTRRAQHGGPG